MNAAALSRLQREYNWRAPIIRFPAAHYGTLPEDVSKDSSDRVILDYDKSGNSAVNVLCLNGVAGNSATTPDNAAFAGATVLDVRLWVVPNDVTVTTKDLFGQYWSAGNKRSWVLIISATQKIPALFLSNDGVTGVGATANAAATQSNYTDYGLRATWRASDGRVQFFTRTDLSGIELSTGWTQLGTDQTISTASVASLYNSDQAIYLGGKQDQATNYSGNFIYADARVVIDGTRIICFDSRTGTKLAGTVTGTTGETWTINTTGATGARISGARDLYQGTAANQPVLTTAATGNYLTFDGSNDYLKSPAFSLAQPETVYFVGSQVTWANNDFVYDGNATNSMALVQFTSSPRVDTYAGGTSIAVSTWTIGSNAVMTGIFNGSSSLNRLNRTTAATGNAGTTAGNGFALGTRGEAGANFANITASEVLVYGQNHDEIAQQRVIRDEMRKRRMPMAA